MISKRPLYAVFPIIVLLGGVWIYGSVLARQPNNSVALNNSEPEINEVANYRQWTRVNPNPEHVGYNLSAACSAPTPSKDSRIGGDPHNDTFITVYVNEIGSHAMLKERTPHFPVGTVIVKEKLKSLDSGTPELLTVMIKHKEGYDQPNGDWEYMVLDGKAEKVQASGRLVSCQACHQQEKATDYVSRRYLPAEVREKLK